MLTDYGKRKRTDVILTILRIVLITLITIAIVYPIFFVVTTSFKTHGEFIKAPFAISFAHPENYTRAWSEGNLTSAMLTSLGVAVVAVACQTMFAALTIFSIGVLKFKGANLLFYIMLCSMYISGELTTIPLFLLMKQCSFTGTMWSLIVPAAIGINGTGVFLGITYIRNIPHELHEAAALDGASIFGIFLHVDLHLLKSVLAYIAITTFTASWNDFFWPFIVLGTGSTIKTIPLALINFQSQSGSNQGVLCAALVFASLPILLLFSFCSKYFMEGVSAGAVKG